MSFVRILKNITANKKLHEQQILERLYKEEMYTWLTINTKFRIIIRQASNDYYNNGFAFGTWSPGFTAAKYNVYVIIEDPRKAIHFKLVWADKLKEMNDELK